MLASLYSHLAKLSLYVHKNNMLLLLFTHFFNKKKSLLKVIEGKIYDIKFLFLMTLSNGEYDFYVTGKSDSFL